METMAFLGCSRGLGQAVTLEMNRRSLCSRALLAARSTSSLQELGKSMDFPNKILTIDFYKEESLEVLFAELKQLEPSRMFYFAGGGPYGNFQEKNWKDHQWALQVSFLTPAKILHYLMQSQFKNLKQIVFIGSDIADSKADPMASSYAASKHGLKGLIMSVQEEKPDFDLRLFRPGYMNTSMLPKNSKPRAEGLPLLEVEKGASQFVDWVMDPLGSKLFTPEP